MAGRPSHRGQTGGAAGRCRADTKDVIKNGRTDVPGRIAQELLLFRDRLRSPEAAEAFQAFTEKRKPDFSSFP